MEIENTRIEGCFIIKPRIFEDDRGYFFESFNQGNFESAIGRKIKFVQDNQSFSTQGVLRGLHFQEGDYAQSKLVRVLHGNVLDVAVDLREKSPTYGNVVTVPLTSDNHKQLFIPKGCAHGFITLSDVSVFAYKCDNYYHQGSESGLLYNDPFFNIDWQFPEERMIISGKDKILPTFKQLTEKAHKKH